MTTEAERAAVIEHRLNKVEEAVLGINASMQALVRLEERHVETREALARAFKAIEKTDDRVKAIEGEMPTLKLTRGWVIAFTLGGFSLLALAVAAVVLRH